MKEIKLTQGKVALVDDADYEWLMQWKWHAFSSRGGRRVVAKRTEFPSMKTIYMNRLILGLTDPSVLGDHEDGDPLNNQRHNLRACDKYQNARNSKPEYQKTFKGVTWNKRGQKWVARITVNNICLYLGRFNSLDAAKIAYNEAAIKHHVEFAWLNPITD